VGTALAAARDALHERDGARFDAQLLLGTILGRNSAWLLAHENETLGDAVARRFALALARRAAGEPVAYILGETGFYGRRFEVTAAVLVPRPESELLVTLAVAALRERGDPEVRLYDVGTGSGILAVTLAAELRHATLVASDVSPAALVCAKRNARLHAVDGRVHFVLGDLLDAVAAEERFACIVANLPYVRTRDLQPFPDPTAFEPRLALDGGPDGLGPYRRLLARARTALEPAGSLLMEAGPDSAHELAEISRRAFGDGATVSVERDYAALERVVRVRAPGERHDR